MIAPTSFHYLFAAPYAEAFPGCATWLAPGLRERVPTCPAGTVLDEDVRPEWSAELAHLVFGLVNGTAEVVFLHRPTATLILTDLAMNVTTIEPAWQRWAWRASGILPYFGPSRSARARTSTASCAGSSVGIVLAHGDPIATDGKRRFAEAFADYLR